MEKKNEYNIWRFDYFQNATFDTKNNILNPWNFALAMQKHSCDWSSLYIYCYLYYAEQ